MEDRINPRTQRARDALMTATRKLVAARPVADISLTEIAEAAGVSRPTVYNQFNDTPTLVAATAEQRMRAIFQEIDECVPLPGVRRGAEGDPRSPGAAEAADAGVEGQSDDGGSEGKRYLLELMEFFVDRVYSERAFSRNAMFGPSSTEITAAVVRLLNEQMAQGVVGQRLRASGGDIDDRLTTISAGVIWLLTQWLDSDFEGENAPKAMARRFADTIWDLSRP